MSIDLYTRVVGGGAAAQFHTKLGPGWTFINATKNMCIISQVPTDRSGQVMTLTIGGNDLITKHPFYLKEGMHHFKAHHLNLLQVLRRHNPDACLLVANIYAPQRPLPPRLRDGLNHANDLIADNVHQVRGTLIDVYSAFEGRQDTLLCSNIEPTLAGATVLAHLFHRAWSTPHPNT
ncbi:MAG: SGNH/GDSL hydrolase family protein [Myxococcota bacterium]